MATVLSYSPTGAKHETKARLKTDVFGVEPNQELIGLAYRAYLANGRSAHASTLKRGQVSGGGKKPWRQKGTGRARVGSIRVPQWRGGGVVFGPTGIENYTVNMPVKMKRAAIKGALSLKAASEGIIVIDDFTSTDGRVKPTTELLKKLAVEGNILLVVPEKTSLLDRATRNIGGLHLVSAKYLSVYTIMNADHIIITTKAREIIEEWLGDQS